MIITLNVILSFDLMRNLENDKVDDWISFLSLIMIVCEGL